MKTYEDFINEAYSIPDNAQVCVGFGPIVKPITKIIEADDDSVTLNITISNLDKSTADDFLKMFAFMEWTGKVGAGREFKAYFDGDGHFRPSIKVDGYNLEDIDLSKDWNDETDDGLELNFGA
jgi:hypothetical protein